MRTADTTDYYGVVTWYITGDSSNSLSYGQQVRRLREARRAWLLFTRGLCWTDGSAV
jgi:hypothetical protein